MKNKIVIGVVGVLVLLGAVYMLIGSKGSSLTNSAIESLNINKGVKCVQILDLGEVNNSITSTLYFYKNKMRYDTVMANEVQGQKDLHSITDDQFTYVWGEGTIGSAFGGANSGIKIANDGKENDYDPDFDIEELKENNFNVPGLKCEKWFPDEKVFELPAGIDFVSLEEMTSSANLMQNFETTGSELGGAVDVCAMCDIIPDETARAECKKSCEE
jgi:hypothetical protein